MYRLSTQFSISAAHYLNKYDGDCARLHGHNWKIKVEVTAQELDETGMAMDFKDLKEISWAAICKYDHQVFNEVKPFDSINPTAENIAHHFYQQISKQLPQHVTMAKLCLWETDKYLVEYSE